MVDFAEVSSCVEMIYGTVAERDGWSEVLARISSMLGAQSGALILQTTGGRGHRTSVGYNDGDDAAYFAGHAVKNVLFQGLIRMRVGTAALSDHCMEKRELHRSDYYAGWLRPRRIIDCAGILVTNDRRGAQWLSFSRLKGAKDFGSGEVAMLEKLAPHLRRAIDLGDQVSDVRMHRAALEAAIDDLDRAVVLLDGAGGVIFANRAAHALDALCDGLRISARGLSGCTSDATKRLGAAIEQTSGGGASGLRLGGTVALPRPSMKPPLIASVCPLDATGRFGWFSSATVMVVVADPAQPRAPAAQLFLTAYGLTETEGRVATMIAQGMPLKSIAERRGVAIDTVRTQLKAIFTKTGTHRQAELVKAMSQFGAL